MRPRTLALAASLVVLVVPAVAADNALLASNHPCAGSIDVNCIHIDCTPTLCVMMRCPVYLGHAGHAGPLFGCTPP